jgi:hypothetical protein
VYRVDTRDVSDKPKLALRDNSSHLYLNTRVSVGTLGVLRAVFLPTLLSVAYTQQTQCIKPLKSSLSRNFDQTGQFISCDQSYCDSSNVRFCFRQDKLRVSSDFVLIAAEEHLLDLIN